MKARPSRIGRWIVPVLSAVMLYGLTGCETKHESTTEKTTPPAASPAPESTAQAPSAPPPAAPAPAPPPEAAPAPAAAATAAPADTSSQNPAAAPATAPASSAEPAAIAPPVRIKAGLTTNFTDSAGNAWQPDQGFPDGDTAERASDLEISNTKDPGLYRTEHYGMTAFSYKVPNGKYTVKLHFAETYDGITGTGQRVFDMTVQGKEFKDFDVWAKAGGGQRAYIEEVPVEVTNGVLQITFSPKDDNPEINGIEILPAS